MINQNKKEGDHLLLSEAPGCFLCGFKPKEGYAMNTITIGPKSPQFFVCPDCAWRDGCEDRVREKFFKIQAERLGKRR
jgi:hypothetical protein